MFINVMILGIAFQLILNLTRPAVPLFASSLGASTLEIGVLTACYAFLPMFFSISAGKMADRFGDRLPVLAGMTGLGLSMALPWCFPSLWALYASQLITGFSSIFIAISLQNVLGHAAPEGKRNDYYGWFSTANSLGALLGPVTAGYLISHLSYPAVFAAAFFVFLITFVFAWKLSSGKPTAAAVKTGLADSLGLLKLPALRRALIGNALALYSREIFAAYFPLYAVSKGISVTGIGWILSIQGLSMVLVRLFMPWLQRKHSNDAILIGSIAASGTAFLLVSLTVNPVWLGVWSVLMGLGLGCGQPISMSVAYQSSPASRTGEVLGLRLLINRVSQFTAPLLFGMIGASLGLITVFYASSFFLLGGTLLIKPPKKE
ncbi:MFS transporter [Paenibacillus sp. FSL R7-0273]|uniref:MFS transporter n=1 Tax=Paenibacillus sp. FSL R7-0273 TaxID=1536772 RepID=UPI0004F5FA7D|nr:MFS transporter [Paenibacillus sp. FSL R7-0273]AIQ47309.1 MFS transporter [Paenibacillus sp. FSL R7-0273]OMF91625.1 MFS transporter [Paenibacillus sp. FSL R7-0273]